MSLWVTFQVQITEISIFFPPHIGTLEQIITSPAQFGLGFGLLYPTLISDRNKNGLTKCSAVAENTFGLF